MARCLTEPEFHGWFGGFLPNLDASQPATLFIPATVSDRSDGKIAHLDGLNLSRAWCWRSLAPLLACRRVAARLRQLRRRISKRPCRMSPATIWASIGWRALQCSRC